MLLSIVDDVFEEVVKLCSVRLFIIINKCAPTVRDQSQYPRKHHYFFLTRRIRVYKGSIFTTPSQSLPNFTSFCDIHRNYTMNLSLIERAKRAHIMTF